MTPKSQEKEWWSFSYLLLRRADVISCSFITSFQVRKRNRRKADEDSDNFLQILLYPEIYTISAGCESTMSFTMQKKDLRIFVATWNVGGKSPHKGLNLDGLVSTDDQSDIYVFGFQEIVPLSACNVLVMEDKGPAAKWLYLINQILNQTESSQLADTPNSPGTQSSCISSLFYRGSRPRVLLCPKGSKACNNLPFFHWPSLRTVGQNFSINNRKQVKMRNCSLRAERKLKDLFFCPQGSTMEVGQSSDDESNSGHLILRTDISTSNASNTDQMKYRLIVTKQMVGISVSIWVQRELVQHVGHVKLSSVGCGILGCLGNKGCIAVSMSVHQTTFCFICSHLASGQKEGDELCRNSHVINILKSTQFPKISNMPGSRNPEKILDHDRVIWLGDLNYRLALSYAETRKLLEQNDWGALLEKDQLKRELEAGRVFEGWKEGKIFFTPTYKYSYNSDKYTGETPATRKKRRTPAWCDRILWHGDGIEQLCYIRVESRLSDHRPVCAVFLVGVSVMEPESAQKLPGCSEIEANVQELLPLNSELSDVTHL